MLLFFNTWATRFTRPPTQTPILEKNVLPCACPRPVHAACLARWQLHSAGTPEETSCRFCQGQLPDWKGVLTPAEMRHAGWEESDDGGAAPCAGAMWKAHDAAHHWDFRKKI